MKIHNAAHGCMAVGADGAIHGSTSHLIADGVLRMTDIIADHPDTTRQLIDAAIDAAHRARVDVACFVPSYVAGLSDALEARAFICEPFHYLTRPLTQARCATPMLRRDADTAAAVRPTPAQHRQCEVWDRDVLVAADLLAGAYSADEARHLTTDGGVNDWRSYVLGLAGKPESDAIDPACSLMVRDARGLAALALVTSLAAETAHLAQIAVRADRRGEGLASGLLDAAIAAAAAAGRQEITLFVAETNLRARHMYDRVGFMWQTTFISARLSHPVPSAPSPTTPTA